MSKKITNKKATELLLSQELRSIINELDAAYSVFDSVVDPDLVSGCIYRINEIQARYQFVLKQLKQQRSD